MVDPTAHHPGQAHRQRHRALPGDGSGGGTGPLPSSGGRSPRRAATRVWQAANRRVQRSGRLPDAVIAMHALGWRGPKSGQVWSSSLETYVHPVIGDLPVAEVTPGHVMAVLEPIWNEKRETARRVKQRISAICRWAVAQGHRTDDPAGIVNRRGAAAQRGRAAAPACAPVRGGGRVHRNGAGQRRGESVVEARARVPGAHRGTLGRSAQGRPGTRSISTGRRGRCRPSA